MSNAAILLGGGKSERMGNGENKILTLVFGKPIFAYSIEAFIKSEIFDLMVIVYKDSDQKNLIQKWMLDNVSDSLKILWVKGGKERQDSVLAGLRVLSNETNYVFIHDMARPLIQADMIRKVNKVLLLNESATLAHHVVDTIKQVLPESPRTLKDLDRKTLWSMETPQAFKRSIVLEAYEAVAKSGLEVTDDVGAVSLLGYPVEVVENRLPNPKITVKSDIDYIKFLLTHKNHATL